MEQFIVAVVLLGLVSMLIWGRYPVAAIFTGAAFIFYTLGYISYEEMASQVTNPGLVTVALLMLVSIVLDKVRLLEQWTHHIVKGDYRFALFKLFAVVGVQSAFLNNTAVVASLIGPIRSATKDKARLFLLPLTYAASLGGVITLIGTSTNLLVAGFVTAAGLPALSIFTPFPVGISLFLLSSLAMLLFYPRILKPAAAVELLVQPYFVEAEVLAGSPLVNRSVEENELRQLVELYLVEIIRGEKLIAPVRPEQTVREGDLLVFSGDITRLDLLTKFSGLAVHQNEGIPTRNLMEVMVSSESMLVNRSIREVDFRSQFDAAVVAVRRQGERVQGRIGNLPLRAGDLLVLAVGGDFETRNNLQRNFIRVSRPIVSKFIYPWQSVVALLGFITVIIGAASGVFDLVKGLICLVVLFLACRLVRASELRSNVPWQLILTIASALVISHVLSDSGLADRIANFSLLLMNEPSPWMALAVVVISTTLLTELMSNNAAAALMFPIALSVSETMGTNYLPFVMAVIYGASASFLTSYGYQTNLMVMSPGGYSQMDYLRAGAPVSFVFVAGSVALIPIFFPF